jgi:hypothetical protein
MKPKWFLITNKIINDLLNMWVLPIKRDKLCNLKNQIIYT